MWRRRLKFKRKRRNLTEKSASLDHEEQYIALMQWMGSNGFKCKNSCLKPAEFPDTGRGLMTKKKLKAGDVLVEIPHQLLITAHGILDSELGQIIRRQLQKPTPQQVVCAFLITERSKGTASFWHPYIDVLPKDFTTPACCFREQSDFNYLPEPAKSKALDQIADIQSSFQNARHLFDGIEKSFPQFHGIFDFQSFLWAWFVINSRSVYMEPRDCPFLDPNVKNEFALAPFLDLLNHSPKADVCASFNPTINCYQISTLDGYHAYDQVFIHYGPHDNASLLLEYGFLIPGNPHDVVCFDIDDVISAVKCVHSKHSRPLESDSVWKRKMAILESEGLHRDLSCSLDGPSWRLQTALRILCMGYPELQSCKRIVGGGESSALSSHHLVTAAINKLTSDAINTVHSKLKSFSDPSLQNKDYLQPVRLMWEEQLHILHATQSDIEE